MSETGQFDGRQSVASWGEDQLADYAREYGRALERYFARRGAPVELRHDLTQEVFMRLAVLAQKESIENGEAYLMRTASSVWIDHLRKKQRRPDHAFLEFSDSQHSPEGFSPERVLEGREALDAVIAALSELPSKTRYVYLLCRIEGHSRKEVAEQLRITVSGIDKHLIAASRKIGLAICEKD